MKTYIEKTREGWHVGIVRGITARFMVLPYDQYPSKKEVIQKVKETIGTPSNHYIGGLVWK